MVPLRVHRHIYGRLFGRRGGAVALLEGQCPPPPVPTPLYIHCIPTAHSLALFGHYDHEYNYSNVATVYPHFLLHMVPLRVHRHIYGRLFGRRGGGCCIIGGPVPPPCSYSTVYILYTHCTLTCLLRTL